MQTFNVFDFLKDIVSKVPDLGGSAANCDDHTVKRRFVLWLILLLAGTSFSMLSFVYFILGKLLKMIMIATRSPREITRFINCILLTSEVSINFLV